MTVKHGTLRMVRPGRQPYPLGTMLRTQFLQQWYALLEPAMGEVLIDMDDLLVEHGFDGAARC